MPHCTWPDTCLCLQTKPRSVPTCKSGCNLISAAVPYSMQNGGVGKKREYNATGKRLQHQAQHLELLVKQEQRGLHQTQDAQLLLAEVILQHRLCFKLLRPLQGSEALQQEAANGRLPAVDECVHLLQMAQTSSGPLLRGAIEATPERIEALAAMTTQEIQQLHTTNANKLLLLLEMLSPERYTEALISTQALADTSTNSNDAMRRELEQEAEQLLARLQEFRQLFEDISKTSLLLMLHAGQAMVQAANSNFMTGQATIPPSSHYTHAVHRLRLTFRQVQHFQLMLKQYNRITQQQAQAGQELVGLSENSFSLSVVASCQESSSGTAVSKQQGRSSPGAGELASDGAHTQTGLGAASAAAADDAQSPTRPLEELLEHHLLDRGDTMGLMSTSAMATQSQWQCGEFIVACYPFFNYSPAFIELSTFLKPCDQPLGYINAGCCEAVAQAAALAAEIGYLDTHPFMQQRCQALEAQLKWALQEARDAT